MSRPGQDLAARLRAGLEARREEERQAEVERQRLARVQVEARDRLLLDLAAFAEAVGSIEVHRSPDALRLGFEGRSLRFEASAPSEGLRARAEGVDVRLVLEPTLGRWVLFTPRAGGGEDRQLLFDAGLAWLMARGLGIGGPAASASGAGR